MANRLGMECKLYRCATELNETDNTPALATWIEITNVRDLTLNLEKGEADMTTRANSGWKASRATLKDGTIDFEMLWDTEDAGFAALQDAWDAGTPIALAAMDGDEAVAGSEGLAANFEVMNFSRSEPLEEGVTVSVSVKPRDLAQWYVVAGS